LERHQTSPRGRIARHVYVHIVIGPIVFFVIIQSMRRVGDAVAATRSRGILFQGTITRSRSLPPRRCVGWHVTLGEQLCENVIENFDKKMFACRKTRGEHLSYIDFHT
ncbi:hypothetical protein WN55_10663, partial [Dufourea novaeangliae]